MCGEHLPADLALERPGLWFQVACETATCPSSLAQGYGGKRVGPWLAVCMHRELKRWQAGGAGTLLTGIGPLGTPRNKLPNRCARVG